MGIYFVETFISEALPRLWDIVFKYVLVAEFFESFMESGYLLCLYVLYVCYSVKKLDELKPLKCSIWIFVHILNLEVCCYKGCVNI